MFARCFTIRSYFKVRSGARGGGDRRAQRTHAVWVGYASAGERTLSRSTAVVAQHFAPLRVLRHSLYLYVVSPLLLTRSESRERLVRGERWEQGPARSLLTAPLRRSHRSPSLLKFKVGTARAAAQCEGVRPAHRSSALFTIAMLVRRFAVGHESSMFTHSARSNVAAR
ncbi:unnamed protein product [Pieris brassicae]|uniref:Uncharacterized protein n=1 Tax=Pieris brassicae TaxID=7116 RepID=A0A9P0TJQ5_PIEBR|nr:unnamed protein product [Pieris brassicae]